MKDFLEEILDEREIKDLEEILDFSLTEKLNHEELAEKIAVSNFLQVKLTKILLKLKLLEADLEVEFDTWFSSQFRTIAEEYDGIPELLKTSKDYEREIKTLDEYKATKKALKKLEAIISVLQTKEKEFNAFDWKVKSIIDLEKIKNNLSY